MIIAYYEKILPQKKMLSNVWSWQVHNWNTHLLSAQRKCEKEEGWLQCVTFLLTDRYNSPEEKSMRNYIIIAHFWNTEWMYPMLPGTLCLAIRWEFIPVWQKGKKHLHWHMWQQIFTDSNFSCARYKYGHPDFRHHNSIVNLCKMEQYNSSVLSEGSKTCI